MKPHVLFSSSALLTAFLRAASRPRKSVRYFGVAFAGLTLLVSALTHVAPVCAQSTTAAANAPIIGEINRLTLNNAADVWSGGVIVVGGQNVTIPRNLLIDLPANRLTLQQIFAQAPAACAARGETGLAKADTCNASKSGSIASITAIRTAGGNVIAADVFFQKGIDSVSGVVTYIDRTNGYFRLNGNPNDPYTGTMVRLNDPTGRHTLQQGPGCQPGSPNCSPDPRFTEDPENYTQAFGTGYPLCIPSTVARQFTDTLDLNGNGNITEILTAQSAPDGSGDVLCPATNRTTPSSAPLLVDSAIQLVDDSRRLAPIVIGDHILVRGNFETVNNVHFLSAFSSVVSGRLETKEAPGQPDYLTISELFVESPGFQGQRVRSTIIGWTSLDSKSITGVNGSDVLLWSAHYDPSTNSPHEFPFGSVRGCDLAAGKGKCTNNEGAPNSFRLRYIIGFSAPPFAKKPEDSACNVVRAETRFQVPGKTLCPSVDATGTPSLEDEFGILSPIPHEMQARTGRKVADLTANGGQTTLRTIDLRGNDAPNGEYLFPMGINLGGIAPPEMAELNPGLLGTPFNVSGFPWNLDRRLSPNGCIGVCEKVAQPLDPFPFEGVDPRTQANSVLTAGVSVPTGQFADLNFTHSSLSNAGNRILSYVSPEFGTFDGNNTVLNWPPLDPPSVPLTPAEVYKAAVACDTEAPSKPASLSATAVSATGINLTWTVATDNLGVSNYLVFRDGIALPLATVNGTSFAVGGLMPLTAHTFTVVAIDAAGNLSASTNPASATTLADTTAPTVPEGLLATAVGQNAITLTWLAATDDVRVGGYRVFRDGVAAALVTVTGNSFSDSGLAAGSTHSYRVAAIDAALNQSAQSNTATATTSLTNSSTTPSDNASPTAPLGLTATGISSSQISLTWNAASDNIGVAGYKIYRDGFATEVATIMSGTAFVDSFLIGSTTHSYTVQAFDVAGNMSAQSQPAAATTQPLGVVNTLVLSVNSVKAGTQPFPTGTVTVSSFAPLGGTVVNLLSSRTDVAAVPATVVVPPGQRTTSFSILTFAPIPGGVATGVLITATINGAGPSVTLNVTP
jgi:chitodextrinase